jgi:plastocyanin
MRGVRAGHIVAVLVVAWGAAACAADPSDVPSGTAAPTAESTAAPEPDTSGSGAGVAPNGESVTLQVIDNSFRPAELSIAVGTEVVFENRGRNDHNVLPKGDPAGSAWGVQKEQFAPGASYAHVFTEPGTYAYYCSIHGTDVVGMVGTITVTAP